jgi:uncharacterized Tic20 family protein
MNREHTSGGASIARPANDTAVSRPRLPELFLAAGAHLSSFVAPFLAPLIIWLITIKWLPYVSRHARQALVSHLLTWVTIAVLGVLALGVFFLLLGGTLTVPPAGGAVQVAYFIIIVLLLLAALLVWVGGQISSVYGAIRAIQGKPAHGFWRRRRPSAKNLS